MSGVSCGTISDTVAPAGSRSRIAAGVTASETGTPVTAQRETTWAVRPISAGKNKVSKAHQVYRRRPSTSNVCGVPRNDCATPSTKALWCRSGKHQRDPSLNRCVHVTGAGGGQPLSCVAVGAMISLIAHRSAIESAANFSHSRGQEQRRLSESQRTFAHRRAGVKLGGRLTQFARSQTDAPTHGYRRCDEVRGACRGLQDVHGIQSRESVGRFIRISSVTSCRSSADEIGTVSHFPSG